MTSQSRRELHTGSLRQLRGGVSRRDRIIVVVSLALVVLALVLVLVRRDPPAPEVRVVTVPVPLPVEKQVIIEPPVPVPAPPVPAPVVPAPHVVKVSTPAAPPPAPPPTAPSASDVVTRYRSVAQTLETLDRDHGDPLRQRFRWIRLADYLVTPEKRALAVRLLDEIASDARGQ